MWWLPLTILLTQATPIDVVVFVPLCDGAQLACGAGGLGDPRSLDENLYWGARYGAHRFLARKSEYREVARVDAAAPDAALLRSVELVRRPAASERSVRVTLLAYRGDAIDTALADFVRAVETRRADLVVWAGHDRLMDVSAPAIARAPDDTHVAVLACSSARYFGPLLDAAGAKALAMTLSFMAPEGYLIDALAVAVARHGLSDPVRTRALLVDAYARYQRISPRAASSVFARLPER